jgi:excisionase family DNA binding protein
VQDGLIRESIGLNPKGDDVATVAIERKTLSIEEAAKVLGISRAYAYQQANAGTMPGCIRIGNRFVVSIKKLNEYIDGDAA